MDLSIINDTEPVVKPEQALIVTEILEAIYKSAQTGKAVTLTNATSCIIIKGEGFKPSFFCSIPCG